MKLLSALALAAALTPAVASASPQQLVRQAIQEGHAAGEVDGPVAEEARRKLNATGALLLEVKRVYRFEQDGCARVQLDFTQAAALLPNAAVPAPYSWSTQMNVCLDGYPPPNLKRRDK